MSGRQREEFLASLQQASRYPQGPRSIDAAHLNAIDQHAGIRSHVAILSMGNSAEGHSAALAPDIDDRIGIHVATRVANITGARYLGHSPYATDRLGGLAKVWSPACLSVDEFVTKTTAYLKFILGTVERPAHLWLLSGHGGNGAIEPMLPAIASELGLTTCHYALALIAPPELPHLTAQHASAMEHAVGKTLGPGCFNQLAFDGFNRDLAHDFEAATKAQPAAGGMAGYYIYGDARFDAIRNRYPGVKPAIADLVDTRRLQFDDNEGAAALQHTVTTLATRVVEHYEQARHAAQP